jgi:transcriptional regulator with XRE-family HTH domain
LLALRKRAGLSQMELARLVGVSQANVALWERSSKPPRSDVLGRLAKTLGVAVEDLLGGKLDELKPLAPRKRGPVGKLQKAFEEASALPRRHQEKVVAIVTALVHEYRREAS